MTRRPYRIAILLLLVVTPVFLPGETNPEKARGLVFEDLNRNGIRDEGEPGLPKVLVSNQTEVVETDAEGRWELPVREDGVFFVVKPQGFMTPLNEDRLPQFFYSHKPEGSPETEYPGVAPTGPLPDSIDFPLHRQEEPEKFQAIFLGDTQSRDTRELDYLARDLVPELMRSPARFGVTLGDILFDDLSLFEAHNNLIATVGIPWYNVIGNHDINFDAPNDALSDETFERHFGPNYYAYHYGPVQFIVLDNIHWGGSKESGGTGAYSGRLGEQQIAFLKNLLPKLDEDRLVMLMMHIPLRASDSIYEKTEDREDLFALLERFPYSLSISGHTHWHAHLFLGKEDGWNGKEPHHHVVCVTACGSWWRGEPDEQGIPHSMLRDGAPRGYSLITFDGNQAVVDFKATRRPDDYQMRVHLPESAAAGEPVYVNVFNGSSRSTVRMRVGEEGQWISLKQVFETDPGYVKLKSGESEPGVVLRGLPLPKPVPSRHLWKAGLPAGLGPGVYRLWVQTEDQYGRVFDASAVLEVK